MAIVSYFQCDVCGKRIDFTSRYYYITTGMLDAVKVDCCSVLCVRLWAEKKIAEG